MKNYRGSFQLLSRTRQLFQKTYYESVLPKVLNYDVSAGYKRRWTYPTIDSAPVKAMLRMDTLET